MNAANHDLAAIQNISAIGEIVDIGLDDRRRRPQHADHERDHQCERPKRRLATSAMSSRLGQPRSSQRPVGDQAMSLNRPSPVKTVCWRRSASEPGGAYSSSDTAMCDTAVQRTDVR